MKKKKKIESYRIIQVFPKKCKYFNSRYCRYTGKEKYANFIIQHTQVKHKNVEIKDVIKGVKNLININVNNLMKVNLNELYALRLKQLQNDFHMSHYAQAV